MLVRANNVLTWDNMRAAFWPWLTLVGFVVFPSTFTSFQNSESLNNSQSGRLV